MRLAGTEVAVISFSREVLSKAAEEHRTAQIQRGRLVNVQILCATTRFYRNARTYRIWGSVFWCTLLLFWFSASWTLHDRHPWQPLIWVALSLIQLGTLWTYWDINATALVAHSFGVKRTFQLSAIDQVGPPAAHRRLLAKTVQIDYRGRQTLFVTVADRETFQETLRSAVLRYVDQRPGSGILGLGSRSQ